MNLDRLISMIVNMLVRRGVNEGINRGVDALSRRGKRAEDLTPEEAERAKSMRSNANSARKLLRQSRRFMRF